MLACAGAYLHVYIQLAHLHPSKNTSAYVSLTCRYIPQQGEVVWARIEAVMEQYKGKKDSAGDELFTEETWQTHKQQYRLVVELNGLAGMHSGSVFPIHGSI
jgi:hypothetical protein